VSTKKIIINIIGGAIIFICGICTDKYIRFRRVSGASDQLVDGVVLSRETRDKLANELNLGGVSLKSGIGYDQALLEGVGTLRKSSEVGRVCTNAIEQSIESDEKFNEELRRNVSGYFDAADYAIDISIKHAELYESIIRSYEQAKSDNGENNKESE
jgi:hypothetical protein